ncbi:MAG: AAA family ATPase [Terriglobales bacterium]
MRKWMRERMKRRKKKGGQETEATGRVGQPKPEDSSGPAPLQPMYPSDFGRPPAPVSAAPKAGPPVPAASKAAAPVSRAAPAISKPAPEMEIETQPESPSAPPARPAEAMLQPPAKQTPRAPRGVVVLAIGMPGSGKTTWFKRRGVTPLSSDMLRSILFDDITEQRYQSLVFSTLRSLLRARLIAKMPWNYVDATNLSPGERRQWIKMAKALGYEVQAVYFDVPIEVCLERNKRRERMVPEEVMRRLAAKLKPPAFDEGFSKIVVVRVKQKAD